MAVCRGRFRILSRLSAAGSIGAICFFDKLTTSDPWFLLPGLVLAVMSAGYIGGKFKEDAFWLFNARFALAIILATAVVCILCGGLTAILASLEYLFEFEVDAVHYRHVWTTGIALFGPVYGLSLMPKRFDEVLLMPSVRFSNQSGRFCSTQLHIGSTSGDLRRHPSFLCRQGLDPVGTPQRTGRLDGSDVCAWWHGKLPHCPALV